MIDYSKIPEHTMSSMQEYVINGRPCGDFLRAVISNDLFEAVSRADLVNRSCMFEICSWFINNSPIGCHGSRDIYNDWVQNKAEERLNKLRK